MSLAGIIVSTPPSQAALSLAEVKAFISHDFADDDVKLEAEIASAQAKIEAYLKRKLITQTLTIVWDRFAGCMLLPCGPVQSVDEIRYKGSGGTLSALDASVWQSAVKIEPARIMPAYGQIWPVTGDYPEAVEADVVVGYGDTGASVPADILLALKLSIATSFEKALVNDASSAEFLDHRLRNLLSHHVLHI